MTTLTTTARAARQLQAIDPVDAIAVLDYVSRQDPHDHTTVVEIAVHSTLYRVFVGRHRDGGHVLLGVAQVRPP